MGSLAGVIVALSTGACAGNVPRGGPMSALPARTSPAAAAAKSSYRMTQAVFPTALRGYGEFVSYAPRCQVAVGATTNGGKRFSAPVPVATWRCASELGLPAR